MKKRLLLYASCLGLFNLATAQQTTYSFTGGIQTFTVPCGVNAVHIAASGAQGGDGATGGNSSTGGAGGKGSLVEGDLAVSPGDVLNIFVGGQGATPTGGFNGGGNGGSQNAGGGGGASDVRVGGTADANRIIVAGGGGGGGRGGCEQSTVVGGGGGEGGGGVGGNGIDAPTPNSSPTGVAGGGFGGNNGGVQGAAGNAGIGCSGFLGSPGTAGAGSTGGNGGAGQSCCCFNAQSIPAGGGGGGGYLGGGGGGGGSAGTTACSGNDKGAGGGGGGGSNYVGGVTNSAQTNGVVTGNGQVVISWTYNAPSIPQFTTAPSAICLNSEATYTVINDPYTTTFNWTVTGGLSIQSGLGSNSVTVLCTGDGTISVTAQNACETTTAASTAVTATPLPIAAISGFTTICEGATATLNALGGNTYSWSNGLGNSSQVTVSPTTNTTYSVTVTDVTSCTATASQEVTVNTNPTASISGVSAVCEGTSATLTAAGGTSYSWDNGLGNTDQVTVSPTTATTYGVTVTDGNNCTATAQQTVAINTLPVASVSGNNSVCAGTSTTLTATGGTSYSWDNGLGSGDVVTVTPANTTTYGVTVTDANSCSNTATYAVTVLEHTSSQFSQSICSGDSYLFNGIAQTASGAYTDTLVNANGCDSIITLNLTVNPLPQPTVTNASNVLSTQSYDAYQWLLNGAEINSATDQTFTATSNGNYSVVVTDVNGCSDTSNVINVTGLSINATTAEAGLKLYPNPSNGRFVLEFNGAAEREIAITDVVGKVVYSTKAITQTVNVNTELAAGVYSVLVTRNKQTSTIKITITK